MEQVTDAKKKEGWFFNAWQINSLAWLLSLALFFFALSRVSQLIYFGQNNIASVVVNQLQNDASPGVQQLVQQRLERRAEDNALVQRWLGFVYLQEGKQAAAYEQWASVPEMEREMVLWGNRWQRYGYFAKARVWYEHTTAVFPGLADGWYYLGTVQEQLLDRAAAQAAFEQGIDQKRFDTVGSSDIYLRLGALVSQQDWQLADRYFIAAINDDQFQQEDAVRAHYLHGQALRRLGDKEAALGVYQALVQEWPAHYWGWVQLGELTWLVEHDFEQAEKALQKAVQIAPSEKWAYRSLGMVYAENGRFADADTMYLYVLERDPNDEAGLAWLQKQEQP